MFFQYNRALTPRVQSDMLLLAAAIALGATVGGDQEPASAQPHDPQLHRIRRGLATQGLAVTIPEPTFHIDVDANAPRLEIPVDRDAYSGGPRLPGGLYAFQMRQMLGNPWMGQPLVKFDVLPAITRATRAVRHTQTARRTRAATQEVSQALVTFCMLNDCTRVTTPRD